jgi:hypothetical protein
MRFDLIDILFGYIVIVELREGGEVTKCGGAITGNALLILL